MELLKRIEKIRQRVEQNPRQYPTDYTIRLIQAVIAEKEGFKNRHDWEQLLLKGVL